MALFCNISIFRTQSAEGGAARRKVIVCFKYITQHTFWLFPASCKWFMYIVHELYIVHQWYINCTELYIVWKFSFEKPSVLCLLNRIACTEIICRSFFCFLVFNILYLSATSFKFWYLEFFWKIILLSKLKQCGLFIQSNLSKTNIMVYILYVHLFCSTDFMMLTTHKNFLQMK